MDIKVIRYGHGLADTLGVMLINCEFVGYTLEDEYRNIKVHGETRIPAGTYEIKFRKVGGFHNRYLNKFGEKFHKGMLELQNVPNFKYILIHIGNTEDDTAGCLLVGDSANYNKDQKGFVSASTIAYKRIYPQIAAALEAGEKVNITIEDI